MRARATHAHRGAVAASIERRGIALQTQTTDNRNQITDNRQQTTAIGP